MKVIIPAYVAPGDVMLANAVAATPAPAFVVMNQNSGDTLMAGAWLAQADSIRQAGIKVLAYVYTSSAARSLTDVKASINKQLVTGDGILHFDGVFMDETTRDVGSSSGLTDWLDYYTALYAYVKATAEGVTPGAGDDMLVAHNPGTAVDDRYVTAPAADLVCTWEGTESDYNSTWLGGNVFSLPSGVYRLGTDLGAGLFIHLVQTVSSEPGMQAVVKTAARRNASFVYATDDVLPNPWDVTPSWGFSAEASFAAGQGSISYSPQSWIDGAAGNTPLSASRLTVSENGIADATTRLALVQAESENAGLWSTFRGRSSATIRGMSAATLTAMASPPTLSYNAGNGTGPSGGTSQITGSAYIVPADSRLHYYSGTPTSVFTVYEVSPVVYGPHTSPALGPSLGIGYMGFDFDGQAFEIAVFGSNQQSFRIWVDGVPHSTTPVAVTPADFQHYLLKVDFGSRAYRNIVVEGAGNAFTNWYWGGLRALPADTITNPSVGASSPSLIVFGDDYVTSVTGTNAAQGWAPLCGQMLGWGNTASLGVGGTGFTADASGGQQTYVARAVHELYDSTADIIVIQGSINDGPSAGMSTLDSAIGSLLDGVLSNTSAQVFLTSILRKPTTTDVTVNAQLAAAAATRPVTYIDASGFIGGTGNSSSATGDGNADYYMQSSGQLTQAGNYAMATFVSDQIAATLGAATR